jgi:hypothetical protein
MNELGLIKSVVDKPDAIHNKKSVNFVSTARNISFQKLTELVADTYCQGDDFQEQKAALSIVFLDGRPRWYKFIGFNNSKEALYASIWQNEYNYEHPYYLSCLKLMQHGDKLKLEYSKDPIQLTEKDYFDIVDNGIESKLLTVYKLEYKED